MILFQRKGNNIPELWKETEIIFCHTKLLLRTDFVAINQEKTVTMPLYSRCARGIWLGENKNFYYLWTCYGLFSIGTIRQ